MLVATSALVAALSVPAFAAAAPSVALKLSGVVIKTVDGVEKRTPVETVALKPGDEVEYEVVASNTGSSPALRFRSTARIPAGTAYIPGTAKADDATPEFSIDGGKTWSAAPTITVNTSDGPVLKKADPSRYTGVRFVEDGALAPGARELYSYEVRVK